MIKVESRYGGIMTDEGQLILGVDRSITQLTFVFGKFKCLYHWYNGELTVTVTNASKHPIMLLGCSLRPNQCLRLKGN
jgi:hypothetical protein